MRAGLLNERIQLYEPTITQDADYNEQTDTWTLVRTCWACVKWTAKGREVDEGNFLMNSDIQVNVRNSSKVNERQRIVWQGKTYRITSLNANIRAGITDITAERLEEEL